MDKITQAMKLMEKAMALLEQAKAEQPEARTDRGPMPSSGAKGVVQDKRTGKWGARVWKDGESVWLGTFETHFAASQAVQEASSTLPHLLSKECG